MSTQRDPAKLFRLRAEVIRQSLPDLCRKENTSMTSALRVARVLVYQEDVEDQPPTHPTAAIKTAMEYHRNLHKADEPDYPKGAQERHQKQKEKEKEKEDENAFFSRLLRRTAKALTPEQQERIDAFKDELAETVAMILREDCDDAGLELSEEESTAISDQMGEYIDELLRKKVDDLESQASKHRLGEQVAEYERELIQKR